MASELRVDKIVPTDGVASDSGSNRYGGGIVQILQHTDSTSYGPTTSQSFQQGPQTPTFTLKYPTSKVKVTANFMVYADARGGGYLSAACALYRGSVASGTKITSGSQPMLFASGAGGVEWYIAFQTLTFLDAPGGNTTYSLAFKQNNGSNVAGVRIHGSNFQTVIMLEEFSA